MWTIPLLTPITKVLILSVEKWHVNAVKFNVKKYRSVSWGIVLFEIVVLGLLFLPKEMFSRRKILLFEVVFLSLNESMDIFI